MEQFQGTVSELVTVFVALGGIYFFVGLVLNLAQAQLSSATGDVIGHARALQQGIAMVILLSVAVSWKPITETLSPYFYSAGFSSPNVADSGEEVYAVWEHLAMMLVYLALGGAGTFLTVSAVYSGVGIQLAQSAGMPAGTARMVGKFGTIAAGGLLTLSSVFIANGVLHVLFR